MEDEPVYYVEKILDRKMVRGKPHYLIKWEGYSNDDNTWEPSTNLNAKLVKNYERERLGLSFVSDDSEQEQDSKSDDSKEEEEVDEGFEKSGELLKDQPSTSTIITSPEPKGMKISGDNQEKTLNASVSAITTTLNHSCDINPPVKTNNQKPKGDVNKKKNNKPKPLMFKSKDEEKNVEKIQKKAFQNCKVQQIRGFAEYNEERHMLVKFVNHPFYKLVPHKKMREFFPQELIDFYESQLTWAHITKEEVLTDVNQN